MSVANWTVAVLGNVVCLPLIVLSALAIDAFSDDVVRFDFVLVEVRFGCPFLLRASDLDTRVELPDAAPEVGTFFTRPFFEVSPLGPQTRSAWEAIWSRSRSVVMLKGSSVAMSESGSANSSRSLNRNQ